MIPFPATGFRTSGYPGWNPVDRTTNVTMSSASMVSSCAANATFGEGARGTVLKTSGLLYFEMTVGTVAGGAALGICNRTGLIASGGAGGLGGLVGRNAGFTYQPLYTGFGIYTSGSVQLIRVDGGVAAATGGGLAPMNSGNIIAFAINFTTKLGWIKNLSYGGTTGQWNLNLNGDPAAGTNGVDFSSIIGTGVVPFACAVYGSTGTIATFNPGTSSFAGTVPSGFSAAWK